jgi:hypothetical protein
MPEGDAGCWILDTGYWILDAGTTGNWELGTPFLVVAF